VVRLGSFFPSAAAEVTKGIVVLIRHREIGKLSVIFYGLLSYQLFASIENSMDVVFKVIKKRHIISSFLTSLLAITLIMAVLILSFVAASLVPLLTALKEYLPVLRIGKVTAFLITYVIPFVLALFVFTIAYRLFPHARVKTGHAFKGALFTSVFLEAAKHFFTWYVVSVAHFGKIYGSLTTVFVFLLWVFYSSSIFLIGAEIVHGLGKPEKGGGHA
jgi:membrane protein